MESTSTRVTQSRLCARGLGARFCLVPFTTLIIEPDGQVGCCRQKGSDFPVGNLHQASLEEIWNGPFLRKWRREFLKDFPEICQSEVRTAACNLCPDYNSLLEGVIPEEIQTSPPVRLGLNLNGKCNLRCQMCVVWQKPDGILDQLGILEKISPLIPTLKEVELHSGEPFIQRDTYRLMTWISERNSECLWTITTNGHWRLSPKIESFLDQIKLKNLIVSLDSLDPRTYSSIRKRGRLTTVLDNLARLRDYDRRRITQGLGSLNIRVNFLIQKDNWREIAGIHEFERATGLQCFRTFLLEPVEFSLLNLSQIEREAILDHYEVNLDPSQLRSAIRVMLPLIYSLPRIDQAEHWRRLRELMQNPENSEVRTPPTPL